MSTQEASLACASRAENLCVSNPLCCLMMSLGDRCPMKFPLVGAEGYDRSSESGSEVGSSVGFYLGGTGSGVGSTEVILLGDSWGSSSS